LCYLITTLADRGEYFLQSRLQHLLEHAIAKSTPPIAGLEFIQEHGVLLEGI